MKVFEEYLKQNHAKLTCYVQTPNDELPHLRQRPGVLILPGGGYTVCSAREAEPVALAYLHAGYQAFVLEYSTGDRHSREGMAAVFPKAFADGVEASEFEAIAAYSDLAQTGEFTCSNEKVNRLVSAAQWSMKSNFLDVPTDCPTRERLAWTGDAQIFFDTGSYFMDAAPFFRKWLRDLRDAQKKSGQLPAVAPYSGASMLYDNTGTSAGWLDCGVLLPYRFWKRYGDLQTLREAYPLLRDTAEFMLKHTGHKDKKAAKADPNSAFVYEHGVQLGEWLEPENFRDEVKAGRTEAHAEEATAYFFYSMTCTAEAAHALGEAADEARFRSAAEGAKRAYQALFLRSCPDTDRQAKLVRPLTLGLADGEMAEKLEARLAQAVQNREYRIGTGFLSTPFVLDVLTTVANHAEEMAQKLSAVLPYPLKYKTNY